MEGFREGGPDLCQTNHLLNVRHGLVINILGSVGLKEVAPLNNATGNSSYVLIF